MVFSRMNLSEHPAHSGTPSLEQNEEVLGYEPFPFELIDHLDVCQPLPIGAHFVSALHDVDTVRLQHTIRFERLAEIEVQDGFVVLLL